MTNKIPCPKCHGSGFTGRGSGYDDVCDCTGGYVGYVETQEQTMKDEYGRIAYEAYCEHTNWKSLATGQSLPQWDGLKPEIREAWIVSSDALAKHIIRDEWSSTK